MKTKKDVIKYFGGYEATGKKLGISRQAVYKWKRIPELRLRQLEEITDGFFNLKNTRYRKK